MLGLATNLRNCALSRVHLEHLELNPRAVPVHLAAASQLHGFARPHQSDQERQILHVEVLGQLQIARALASEQCVPSAQRLGSVLLLLLLRGQRLSGGCQRDAHLLV